MAAQQKPVYGREIQDPQTPTITAKQGRAGRPVFTSLFRFNPAGVGRPSEDQEIVVSVSPNYVGNPKLGLAFFQNSDGNNLKDLVTAGSGGSKVVSIFVSTDEATPRNIQLCFTRSGTDYYFNVVEIAAGAGIDTVTPSEDLLSPEHLPGLPVDADGQRYLFLESGDKIRVRMFPDEPDIGFLVWVKAIYGDF